MTPLASQLKGIKVNDLPEDSLLRLRPVREALQDPHFSLTCRPIDCNWNYAGLTDVMSGFNPTLHTHFYSATSTLRRWLRDPIHLGREINEEDRLVREVLHMAHDYLHSWAYRAIEHLDSTVGVNQAPITRDNLDDFAYLHLLTEAAAVVGLDYWFLCVKDVSRRCSLGSLVGPRTVEYREEYLPEYRRFNPGLVVQDADFFRRVVELFCSNEFHGFSLEDMRKSPALFAWLMREIQASHSQRFITRLWLSRLGGVRIAGQDLHRPLPPPSRRQRHLAHELGILLWKKIKLGAPLYFAASATGRRWRYKSNEIDFRVCNLQRTPPKRYNWRSLPQASETFSFYVQQYVSQFRFPVNQAPGIHEHWERELETIKRTFDQSRLERLTARLGKVEPKQVDPAPLELIFMN